MSMIFGLKNNIRENIKKHVIMHKKFYKNLCVKTYTNF